MADDADDVIDEADGDRPARRHDAPGTPTAVLFFPFHEMPPAAWRQPWVRAGWTITLCGTAEEVPEALGHQVEMTLVASPWPGSGNIGSANAMASEMREVIAALGGPQETPNATARGGMMRRGDFLAYVGMIMRMPEVGCAALFAVHVDKSEELASRQDTRTAIFDLEEQIASRIARVLGDSDPYTIWLEFGYGILVRRDAAEPVQALADRICQVVAAEPFVVAGEPMRLTVSVGVALAPRSGAVEGPDRWFAAAHAAQAIAFRHGGNRQAGLLTRDYEPIPPDRVLIIREWVQQARTGDNVMVEFQPVLSLNPGTADLYSVHAKLRDYRDPLGGVYRREYLRIAREGGAMVMIDRMTLFGVFEALEQERARGSNTRLMVPVELDTIEGMPWRWLEAELRRRSRITDGLILELVASEKLLEPACVERMQTLRSLGVQLGVSDRTGGLEMVATWAHLPVDLLRLQYSVVETGSASALREVLALWRSAGRQVIVDAVDKPSEIVRFTELGVDYLRGQGIAAIGPRLDYDFS